MKWSIQHIMILQQRILIPKGRVANFRQALAQRGYKVGALWKAAEYHEGNRAGPLYWFAAEQLSHSFRFVIKQGKIVRVLCHDERYFSVLLEMLIDFVEPGNHIIVTGEYQEQMRCYYFLCERVWEEVPVVTIAINVPKSVSAK
jgi:hypothetical protein